MTFSIYRVKDNVIRISYVNQGYWADLSCLDEDIDDLFEAIKDFQRKERRRLRNNVHR